MLIKEIDIYERRMSGELLQKGRPYKLIDLFAGAGGLTLGFTASFGHKFMPIWANDIDKASVQTYNLNFGNHCLHGDINKILAGRKFIVPAADVVIGGPPCQGFSLLNKNRAGDPRNQLWRPFFKVVERSGASIFLIENVPQLLGSPEFDQITDVAKNYGFKITSCKLCAADYGVPQTRWRAFILGWRYGNPAPEFPPKRMHYNPNNGWNAGLACEMDGYIPDAAPWRTVRDAIIDLPDPVGTDVRKEPPPMDLHFGRTPTKKSLQRYRAVPKEGMNRFDLQKRAPELTPDCWIRKTKGGTDLFGRLWWDRPAFTIRTEFFKPEKGRYLHPRQHRPITHREAARLQSFPDSFMFSGTKIEIARQIGNAVPPLLASRLADCIYALLLNQDITIARCVYEKTAK